MTTRIKHPPYAKSALSSGRKMKQCKNECNIVPTQRSLVKGRKVTGCEVIKEVSELGEKERESAVWGSEPTGSSFNLGTTLGRGYLYTLSQLLSGQEAGSSNIFFNEDFSKGEKVCCPVGTTVMIPKNYLLN